MHHDIEWPPKYTPVFMERSHRLKILKSDPTFVLGAEEYYRTRPIEFIEHFCDTVDPRNAGEPDKMVRMPFILFPRQKDMVNFLYQCFVMKNNGLIEKCRDFGATWVCAAFSVWLWRFYPGSAVGWGSRKEDLVDKLGDMSSIFEKMRAIISGLPPQLLPHGFNSRVHMTYMKILNPANGATIIGETGDNIGRGGRTSIYFKDEAQPLSAKILTPSGWSTMGQMTVGSVVVGSDGSSQTVTHINDCGLHPTYRLKFSDGTSVECSENHLWTVEKRHGLPKVVTLRTSQIIENFKYVSPGNQTQYRYRVVSAQPINFDRVELPLHPYIVGALIGDGSVNSGGITFSSNDPEIVSHIANHLPFGCKVTKGNSFGYRIVDDVRYNKKSRAKAAVMAAGIYGTKADNKSIPEIYKFGSVDARLSLLQGLLDTDGSASGGTVTYHTCSRQLADDVRFVVQSLGGAASLNVKPDHRGFRDMYCLHVALPSNMQYFRLKRKNDLVSDKKQPFGKTIIDVTYIGEKHVRCITVSNPDGLYVTDHCKLTHNSAHYERPEKIQAALDDNTNVQIDISSVNGPGNVFHRKREAGLEWSPLLPMDIRKTAIFIADWSDHPGKNQAWYDARRQKAEDEGLLHLFYQEVERNYFSSVDGVIIDIKWIRAAYGAHTLLDIEPSGPHVGALDVADEGGDLNANVARHGIVLQHVDSWGDGDTGVTTRRVVMANKRYPKITIMYDCIGVGAGVKSEANRLREEKLFDEKQISFVPWNAGGKVLHREKRLIERDKGSPKNKDAFANLKAQGWYSLARRFYQTWRAVEARKNPETGVFEIDEDELISIDPDKISF